MPVPAAVTDLSTTAGSNSPAGSESPGDGDNYIRSLSSFIRGLYDRCTDGLQAITCGALSATSSGGTNTITATDTGVSGANIKLTGNGGATPSKYIRAQSGYFEVVNSAYSAVILSLSDTGGLAATTFSGIGASLTALNASNVSTGTLANARTTATSANTASAIVARDVSGGFSAGALALSTTGSLGTLTVSDTGGNGVNLKLTGNGGVTPSKTIRAFGGNLEIVNDAYGAAVVTVSDAGAVTATSFSGALNASDLSSGTVANARLPKTLDAGTYTPTLTNTTNIAASTARKCQWMRVGNTVTVSGTATVQVTSGFAASLLGISLPVASNLATVYDLAGTSTSYSGATGIDSPSLIGDTVNDRASMKWVSQVATSFDYTFTFSYEVL
jgi:hypothetical protein